jgi:hypothetical protein
VEGVKICSEDMDSGGPDWTNIYGYREKAKDQNRKIEITRYQTKLPTTTWVAQAKDRYGIRKFK